uniref:Non-selective voltage-gated ion channel VDAC1 n=1 Tax=Cyprinus carpio TaxID=7962 RepID=A0A8C2HCU8_CYPCA
LSLPAQRCPRDFTQTMAVPPTYVDLGKSARDIFTKGYGFGLIKLDLKTRSENGLVSSQWISVIDVNNLSSDAPLASLLTSHSKKSGKIKSGFQREHINLGCDVDYDINGTAVHGAVVVGFEGWLAGYQMTFEAGRNRVTQSNFAVGYKSDEFQLHTNVNDGTEFGGSIYQKVNDNLETAVNLAWTAGNSNTRFGIAAKYQIDADASFSAKVNNSSLVGLGYTQTLKPGIKLTLSALLDGKNINAGGHKLGLGLEFEA